MHGISVGWVGKRMLGDLPWNHMAQVGASGVQGCSVIFLVLLYGGETIACEVPVAWSALCKGS